MERLCVGKGTEVSSGHSEQENKLKLHSGFTCIQSTLITRNSVKDHHCVAALTTNKQLKDQIASSCFLGLNFFHMLCCTEETDVETEALHKEMKAYMKRNQFLKTSAAVLQLR